MKKLLTLWLNLLLVLLMAGCTQPETPPDDPDSTPEVQQPEAPKEDEATVYEMPPLQWADDVPALLTEPDWTVETTSEEFLLELTDPKYQGRVTGSAGNRAAADWIESQFIQIGLEPAPDMDGYRHTYVGEVFEILPGYAAIVAADGTERELELGVDWVFKPSKVEVDLTLPLSADLADCEAGTAFLDANRTSQDSPRKFIEIVTGDVAAGMAYVNGNDGISRVTVSQTVYDELTQEGVKLHLKLPVGMQNGQADNVVAYLPGADSKKVVVIGANFDGYGSNGMDMPSAFNNASGVAAMMQTASWLAKAEDLPCDVVFAAFNSGSSGLEGSKALAHYVNTHYDQILMLNLKCIGWRDQPLAVYAFDEQQALRNDLAGALGIQYRAYSFGGDDRSFSTSKMWAVSIFQPACLDDDTVNSVLSSSYDTVDNLDPAMLDELAKDLCVWVLERGGNEIVSGYPVIW